MKRAILLTALTLTVAVPLFAQQTSSEIGVLIGGSRRFIDEGTAEAGRVLLDNEFTFSNSAIDLYWAFAIDEDTRLKFKVGRIEGPVGFDRGDGLRRDADGEVQHASLVVDYRFDEPWGSTGIFGGLGFYRTSGDDGDAETEDSYSDYGFQLGVNADFPISRTYGVIVEGTYHWTRGPYEPKYVTLTGGLRFAF